MGGCPKCGARIPAPKVFFLTRYGAVTCPRCGSRLRFSRSGLNSLLGGLVGGSGALWGFVAFQIFIALRSLEPLLGGIIALLVFLLLFVVTMEAYLRLVKFEVKSGPDIAELNPSVGTARSYATAGFVFYVLATVIQLVLILFALFFLVLPFFSSSFSAFGIISLIVLSSFWVICEVAFSSWAWKTVNDIDSGRLSQARTSSLVLGIVGLLLGLLVGGIFFLLAYRQLNKSIAISATGEQAT